MRELSRATAFALAFGLAALAAAFARGQDAAIAFIRGDANADGEQNVSDAVHLLLCHFLGAGCGSCADAGDANDDGERDVSDPVFLLAYLFQAGPPPPAPGGACGLDPSDDALDCEGFAACAGEDEVATPQGPLVVVPVEHASLALLWNGKSVWADPVGGAALYAGIPSPDIVVITHTHGDHMDAATLRAVTRADTVLIAPASVAQSLAGSGVLEQVDERILANGDSATIGEITVEAVAMYNLTADRLRYHAKGAGNSYVIDFAGTRAYVSGDTEDIPEMRALTDIDVAFLCMNLPFTMTPAQAASAALEFAPRVVYPYHFRGQDPETFRALVEAGSTSIDVRVRDWYR